jgi:SAM-dependent methyltransferase
MEYGGVIRTTGRHRHNAAQREYFEGMVKRTMVPRPSPYLERHLDEALRFGDVSLQDRVLEVGCGMGRYTLLLARRGLRVEGLELSRVLLDRLRQFDAGQHDIPLHCADLADSLPELRDRFDVVLGFFMLHHVHDLAACFAGIRRLLRPGGRAVFVEPNPYNPLFYIQIAVTPGMTWQGDRGIIRMRRCPIANAIAAAGLTRFALRRFGFFPPFLANRPAGARVERVLEKIRLWRPILPFQLFRAERDA